MTEPKIPTTTVAILNDAIGFQVKAVSLLVTAAAIMMMGAAIGIS